MDSDEEKEPIIKERLILDDNSSDSQRGAFSEIFKKTRKNRSGLQAKEERQTNNNQNADLSAFAFDPTTSKLIHTIERGDTLEGLALKYNTTIAELMKENRLFTRAAFYGRKTLTINVTKEQLAAHVKAKQKLEDERHQKQHELILTFCAEMECDEDMARYYLELNHWDNLRAREKLKYDIAMAYKHSLTSYQPYDGVTNANSSADDSQKIEDRQIVSSLKDRALFFTSPAERERQVHPLNKRQMKQLDQMSDIYEL
jgi:hypothetical protein